MLPRNDVGLGLSSLYTCISVLSVSCCCNCSGRLLADKLMATAAATLQPHDRQDEHTNAATAQLWLLAEKWEHWEHKNSAQTGGQQHQPQGGSQPCSNNKNCPVQGRSCAAVQAGWNNHVLTASKHPEPKLLSVEARQLFGLDACNA